MSVVLSSKYSDEIDGTLAFYKSRFIRIFSVYWPIVILELLIWPEARAWFASAHNIDRLFAVALIGSDWRVALADYPREFYHSYLPFMNQAWTLGTELTFYLLAPFILRSIRLIVTLLAFSLATRAALVSCFGFDEAWAYHFFPTTICFFLLGSFAYKVSRQIKILKQPIFGTLLLVISIVFMFSTKKSFDAPSFWASVLCFAAGLPGVFEGTKNNHLINAVGDISYPLYLVHIFVLTWVFSWWNLVSGTKQFFAAHGLSMVGASLTITFAFFWVVILAGLLVHWIIEKPTAIVMRRFIVLPAGLFRRAGMMTAGRNAGGGKYP